MSRHPTTRDHLDLLAALLVRQRRSAVTAERDRRERGDHQPVTEQATRALRFAAESEHLTGDELTAGVRALWGCHPADLSALETNWLIDALRGPAGEHVADTLRDAPTWHLHPADQPTAAAADGGGAR